jgi:hypothetical protein
MIKIVYPPYQPQLKVTKKTGKTIFDSYRKKWVKLTPEEWVRQNFLNYLTQTKNYPASIIAIEKQIKLGDVKKRFDIVVYDTNTQPWMLIECKEMDETLSKKVLDQALQYNIKMQVPYLVITNGLHCMAFACVNNALIELQELPNIS